MANFIGSMIFGFIGIAAITYARKAALTKPAFLGVALIAFPYFIPDVTIMYVVGAALTILLFVWRDA